MNRPAPVQRRRDCAWPRLLFVLCLALYSAPLLAQEFYLEAKGKIDLRGSEGLYDVSSDGRYLIKPVSKEWVIYDLKAEKEVFRYDQLESKYGTPDAKISASGRYFASYDAKQVMVVDCARNKTILALKTDDDPEIERAGAVAFLENETALLMVLDGDLVAMDLPTGRRKRLAKTPLHSSESPIAMSTSANNRRVAICTQTQAWVYDIGRSKPVYEWRTPDRTYLCDLALTPDGKDLMLLTDKSFVHLTEDEATPVHDWAHGGLGNGATRHGNFARILDGRAVLFRLSDNRCVVYRPAKRERSDVLTAGTEGYRHGTLLADRGIIYNSEDRGKAIAVYRLRTK